MDLRVVFLIPLLLAGATLRAQVCFDADFEAGAMGKVTAVSENEYTVEGSFDPANPTDNLSPSANWYFWRITGAKGKKLTIHLPGYGLRGSCISRDAVNWKRMRLYESSAGKIEKEFPYDTCYIAPFIPYTYSYYRERMRDWKQKSCVEIDTIGRSAEGRPLEVLHLTGKARRPGRLVWMHARIHPSETPASWLLDGLIDKLSDDSPESECLRDSFDFYIMPFINPDGVAHGYSRCNARGVNMEINYNRSADSTEVEIKAVKEYLSKLCKDRPLDLVINHHSQRDESASFWMHTAESTSQYYQGRQWTFAGLCCSFNPYMRSSDMQFSELKPRYIEGQIWNKFSDKAVALTIETPYTFYSTGEEVTRENLAGQGKRMLEAIAEYFGVNLPPRIILELSDEPGDGWSLIQKDSLSYLGTSGWIADRIGAEVIYKYEKPLKPGRYDIWKYITGENIHPLKGEKFSYSEFPGIHGWRKAGSVFLLSADRFEYKFRASRPGETADAIMLIPLK